MKILKYVLLLLLVVLVAGAIFVATRPDSFEVTRSKVIKAPAAVIFNNVSDFRNWEAWNPWMEKDTTIKATYPEQTAGIGGAYSWTGKEGGGSMKNIAMVANKSLEQELKFDDFDASKVTWQLEEVEDGTKVTWAMKGENLGFFFKGILALNGGMDNMVGGDYEKGLENLDKVIAEHMKNNPPQPSFRLSDVSQEDSEAQQFIGYHQKTTTDAAIEEMTKLFMTYMPKAGMYAATHQLENYTPGSLHLKWDEETKEAEFYIGLLVGNQDVLPKSDMTIKKIDAGKVIKISKFGPYGIGDMEAHLKIAAYMSENKLVQAGPSWELYVNDPDKVKPENVQTDIYYPVKPAE
ncbi:SRPBCC family protein [uncultured Kordia sp.]|uniref:SRPBCC family protein n=1 Tax=uncultured Kordia sp. TaxID=507699 RepID=UPI0026299628|nr:SRPBCC family protein [uncultured Kordia sp.]